MKRLIITLTALLAFGFMAAQASAWWGSHMGPGPANSAYHNPNAPGYAQDMRADIASTRAKLRQEIAKENPDMDRIRSLNRQLQQKRQKARTVRHNRAGGNAYGHGPHMRGGYGYCR